MIALLVLLVPQWRSTFFENVQLHRGAPPVTIQVAHLEPDHPATDSAMPMVISVFTGPAGARTLVSSTRAGDMAHTGQAPEFIKDPASGEGFLSIHLMVVDKWKGGLFIFDDNKPRLLISEFGVSPDPDRPGVLTDYQDAKSAGVKIPKNDYPNPPVMRELRFDPKTRKFVPGPWSVQIFNMPATADIKGSRNGHTFRIQMEKRNFRLGNRRFIVRGNHISLDGHGFVGGDPIPEDMKALEKQRVAFLTEFVSFRVWIDGKRIRVPESLWRNCFDPNLPPGGELSADGSRLTIEMNGSDGAGTYGATWMVWKSGRCSLKTRSLD